jgi:hypothetical protein
MGAFLIIIVGLVLWFVASALALCLCVVASRGDAQQRAFLAARERAVWGGRRSRNEPVPFERRSRIAA